ncbi:MAG: hypothetical protein H7Y86_12285, partial [Rhizobacter sp.]|nr:hypothetical protein [Ferruginibacter sp.]
MNLQLLPVCRTGKIRKDGTSSIAIQYCFTSDRRAVLDSGLGVPAKYWNKKRRRISDQLPILYGVTAELNERLDDEVRKAQEIISIAIKRKDDPVDFFKVHYKPEKSLESI